MNDLNEGVFVWVQAGDSNGFFDDKWEVARVGADDTFFLTDGREMHRTDLFTVGSEVLPPDC